MSYPIMRNSSTVRRYFAASFDKPLEAFSSYCEIHNRLKNPKFPYRNQSVKQQVIERTLEPDFALA
jgi:hypothetical protein